MKRLLKKTFREYFSAPLYQPRVRQRAGLSRQLLLGASAVTAATLGLFGDPRAAHAFFVYEVDLSTYTPNSLNETIAFPGTSAGVRFQWTGATDTFSVLESVAIQDANDPLTLSGGFGLGSPLNIQVDPTAPNEDVTLTVDFLNGGVQVPVERLRLVVIDIDRDNTNAWQDQLTVGGDAPAPQITPATQPSPPLGISPEASPTLPLGVDDVARGGPGLANPNDFTVDIAGNNLIGVYAPPGPQTLPDGTNVNILGTATEQNPNTGSAIRGGNEVDVALEGSNQSPEGTVTLDYAANAGQPVNSGGFTFGNGPVSLTTATNPPGVGGFLSFAGDNGGPAIHGIGLYTIVFTPGVLGTGKSVSAPTPGPNGTVNVTYQVRVQNSGEVTTLTSVQVNDDLAATFGDPNGFTVTAVRPAGGVNLAVNPDFSGVAPQDTLLVGNGILAPGEFTLIEYDVNIDPAIVGTGPFNNTAISTAQTPIGLPVTDRSTNDTDPPPDGPNPDPNNDGDPLEDTPTPVDLIDVPVIQPAIGVVERVLSSTPTPDGAFGPDTVRVVYEIAVSNIGPEALDNVQLTNSLEQTFGDGSFSVVGSPTLESGAPALNNFDPNYTGDDQEVLGLLGPGVTLQPGESGTIQIVVDVNRNSPTLPPSDTNTFTNQTLATGTGTGSNIEVSDLSDDFNSIDPLPPDLVSGIDPDGDGNAGGPDPNNPENTPTPVTLVDPTTPQIGVSQQVISSDLNPTGPFGADTVQVVYEIVVENIGPEDLNDVRLTNSIEDTFGDGSYELVGLPQFIDGNPNLDTVNPQYDGDNQGSLELLDLTQPGRTLPVGDSSTFRITVNVDTASGTLPNPLPGPFLNQTTAIGIGSQSGLETTDLSNDVNSVPAGQDPIDPNNNGIANEDGENIVTPVSLGANIQVTKRITQVLRNGQPLFVPQINQFNDQEDDDSDNLLQTLSGNVLPPGLFNVPSILQSGDTIEYTVYFFNAGSTPVQNLELCDVIRVPSVLQPDSLELALPSTTPPTDNSFAASSLIEARAPLAPLEPSCEDVTGTGNFPPGPDDSVIPGAGGGVVVGATDGNATSGLDLGASEIGAFRFQVIIP
ncbi:MAG: hypothetical protein AAGF01_01345 [Cyanobacteria bacterium P01_G01_bin.38]